MGIIARTVETSQYALGIRTLQENLPARAILGPEDLPHAPPPYKSLLERTSEVIADLAASGEAQYSDEAFAARNRQAAQADSQPPESTEGTLVHTRV